MKIVHTFERLSYLVIVVIIINITSGIFVSTFIFLCVHVCEHVCTCACSYRGQIRREIFPSISLGLLFEAGFTTWSSAGLDPMASEPWDPLVSSCAALGLHAVLPCPVGSRSPNLDSSAWQQSTD